MKLEIPRHVRFKLEVWRDIGNTEVTGFFITDPEDDFKVIDAILIKAECSSADVDITATSLEEMYLEQMAVGVLPKQLKIWWHTHPGSSAQPSATDETTFKDLGKDRASNIMYILADNGNHFAQISVSDIANQLMLKSNIEVNYKSEPWDGSFSYDNLKAEYDEKISEPAARVWTYSNTRVIGDQNSGVQLDDDGDDYLYASRPKNGYWNGQKWIPYSETDYKKYNEFQNKVNGTETKKTKKELYEELTDWVIAEDITEEEAGEIAKKHGYINGYKLVDHFIEDSDTKTITTDKKIIITDDDKGEKKDG